MDIEELDFGRTTGIALAMKLKKIKPKIPIIAFTVINDPEIVGRMYKVGIVSIVNKPAFPEQVAEQIKKSIK